MHVRVGKQEGETSCLKVIEDLPNPKILGEGKYSQAGVGSSNHLGYSKADLIDFFLGYTANILMNVLPTRLGSKVRDITPFPQSMVQIIA